MHLQSAARCPYCDGPLPKPPSRKGMCPHCQQWFYVRTRLWDRQKVICTAKEADAIDQERKLREILGNPRDLETALHAALQDADSWKRLHLQALFARSRQQYDEAWELYNQCRSVLAQHGAMGFYRNMTHEMARQLWIEGKQKEAICMIAEVSYWDLNAVSNRVMIYNRGRLVGTAGPRYRPSSRSPFEELAPGIIKLTREWVKEAGLSEDEFSELVVEHLERSCTPLKPRVSPQAALPILLEVAMGDTPIDELMGWSREKKEDERSATAGAPSSAAARRKRRQEPGPKSGGCLTAIVAAVIAVMGVLFAF